MRLHQLRHATMIIEYSGLRILVDPMFTGVNNDTFSENIHEICPLHEIPVPPKDVIKNIDAVIITHLHPDHFDKFAQEILPKEIKIFVQDMFDKNALEKEHFKNIEILGFEGNVFEGIKLYKTECRHGVRAIVEPIFLANGMRWEAMGVVFAAENEPTLYLAGDTVWYEGIKEAIDFHKPTYIVLNSSGAELRGEPILMGIEDIKAVHEYYPEGKLLAVHLDCIENAPLTRADLRASEVKDYIYSPADGEIMTLE